MDPLSITASVIALIGALRAVTKSYKSIADLRKGPQEFRDLVGEIESIHAYLGMLHSVLDMGSSAQAFAALDLTPLGASLSRLDYTIQELRSALKETEMNSKTSEDGRKLSKLRWQVYKSKVIQLRDEVRSRKQDLVDKIGLLQLTLSVLHTPLLLNANTRAELSYTRHDHPSSGKPQSTALLNHQNDARRISPHSRIPRCLSASCPCRCHKPMAKDSHPWLLGTIQPLIWLFTVSMHCKARLCDDSVCRDSSQQTLALLYQIPVFHCAISLRLVWDSVFGPGASLHLRVTRVVRDSKAPKTIKYGTLQRLKFLFDEKMALPNDMEPSGTNLLLVAVQWERTEIIDYLLDLGADAFQQNTFGISPVLFVRERAREHRNWTCGSNRLQLLAEDAYDLKPPENQLWEALRNDDYAGLELILNKYPLLVSEPWAFDSTPLHIATKRGLHSAMELLLLRGADIRERDAFGRTALCHAVRRNDYEATEILLRFPGNDNHFDRHGCSPFDLALLYSSSKMVSLLLSSGILLEPRRDYISDALTVLSLRHSIDSQDEDDLEAIVRQLLNAGCDFNIHGGHEFKEAVRRGNWHLLRVLLKFKVKFNQSEEIEYNILHEAANYARLDTIGVLREANIEEIDADAEFRGWTAIRLFEYRETCPDERLKPWQTRPTAEESVAFRTLIHEVRERRKRIDDEMIRLVGNGIEENNVETDEMRVGEKDRKMTNEQLSIPGAWVE
ncbi:ankyrin repeat-containing domain protein [Xylaria grammica]|nr:ankyrin repeat-containing domain protein [Xylaria grammica]